MKREYDRVMIDIETANRIRTATLAYDWTEVCLLLGLWFGENWDDESIERMPFDPDR